MTAAENSIEIPNNASNITNSKQECIELTTFKRYSKLVPELREHSLSYAKRNILKEYSQCSKLCNIEIQKYNTEAPYSLVFQESNFGIKVRLDYERSRNEKIFPHGCTMNVDAEDYVLEKYKYVKHGKTKEIFIKVGHWPAEILQIKHLANADMLTVHLNNFVLNDFMRFARTTNFRLKSLNLRKWEKNDQVVVPPDFFKSNLVKNVSYLHIDPKCVIYKEDFVDLSLEYISVNSWIDIDFLQEKFIKHIDASAAEHSMLKINLPKNETRVFDFNKFFPAEKFPQRTFDINSRCFEIGTKIQGSISGDRKELMVYFREQE